MQHQKISVTSHKWTESRRTSCALASPHAHFSTHWPHLRHAECGVLLPDSRTECVVPPFQTGTWTALSSGAAQDVPRLLHQHFANGLLRQVLRHKLRLRLHGAAHEPCLQGILYFHAHPAAVLLYARGMHARATRSLTRTQGTIASHFLLPCSHKGRSKGINQGAPCCATPSWPVLRDVKEVHTSEARRGDVVWVQDTLAPGGS